ncbi:hypothetical protein D3C85_1320830 [compost metagenome]
MFSSSRGVPAEVSTITASLVLTVKLSTSPLLYAPAAGTETVATLGTMASTNTPLVLGRPLRGVPASLPSPSRRVAPLSWRVPATLMPLLSSCPLATVRRNTRAVLPEPDT